MESFHGLPVRAACALLLLGLIAQTLAASVSANESMHSDHEARRHGHEHPQTGGQSTSSTYASADDLAHRPGGRAQGGSDPDEPFIRNDADRYAIDELLRPIANPRTDESTRQRLLEELAALAEARHQSLPEIVLMMNRVFSDYRHGCRDPIVQSTLARINQVPIFATDYRSRLACDDRSRVQGMRTIVQIVRLAE